MPSTPDRVDVAMENTAFMKSLKPTHIPVLRFAGSHRAFGQAYGETCRELIAGHLDLALARTAAARGWSSAAAIEQALAYRAAIQQHAAFFDDEVQGLAEGAGLTLGQAYLLQLRAELNPSRAVAQLEDGECTTFAVDGTTTADAAIYAGQVPDLPQAYAGLSVVLEVAIPGKPALLMFTPAGQLSYIGINSLGLCCFANYLHCDGWRVAVPRYFLSRIALTQSTVADALRLLRTVPRASSRNLLMADAGGHAVDLETTVDDDAEIAPRHGVLAHANHYVSDRLAGSERGSAAFLANSRQRHARMQQLLEGSRGRLDLAALQAVMRDRAHAPDCISRAPGDGEADVQSVAAVLASPTRRCLWVAAGPPHEHAFNEIHFSEGVA